MEAVILSFTLKGQNFDAIAEAIKNLSFVSKTNWVSPLDTVEDAVKKQAEEKTIILIHGFMPRKEIIEKGFPTFVIDLLEECFPVRLNMYNNGKPLREEMAEVAKALNAKVYVIGEVKEGVKEEVELYEKLGLEITMMPLDTPSAAN